MINDTSVYVLELLKEIPEMENFVRKEIETYNLPINLNEFFISLKLKDGVSTQSKVQSYLKEEKRNMNLIKDFLELNDLLEKDNKKEVREELRSQILSCVKEPKRKDCSDHEEMNQMIGMLDEESLRQLFSDL